MFILFVKDAGGGKTSQTISFNQNEPYVYATHNPITPKTKSIKSQILGMRISNPLPETCYCDLQGTVEFFISCFADCYGVDVRLASVIIDCEGGTTDSTICNRQFGCPGGQGHWQIVPNTWNNIINAGILPSECNTTEAVFNSYCNIWGGTYLLAKDGIRHWGSITTWWGSYRCWYPKYYSR